MRLVIVACAALVLAGQAAWAQNEGSISLAFSDTEVAQVLKAIGVRTGASIVYSGQDKLPITLNVKADSLEDAIRSVVSAAGLSYRKVNRTYVVAKPDALRQALQPFSYRIALDPTGDPVQAFKMLEDAYPQASVKLLGERILFFGVPEDIAGARRLLRTQKEREKFATGVVNLQYADPRSLATMLMSTYGGLKISPIESKTPAIMTGSLVISGPESEVEAAKIIAGKVDGPSASARRETSYKVYNIRYSSAPALLTFLKQTMPEVECVVGPEAYSPFQTTFKPLSQGASKVVTSSASGSTTSGTASSKSSDLAANDYKENDRSKMLVLRGSEAQLTAALELLAQVDVQPRQVAVEVKVVDTTPEFSSNIGLTHSWAPFSFQENHRGAYQTESLVSTKPVDQPNAGVSKILTPLSSAASFGQFARTPWSIQSILNASIKRSETKLLASPNLLVTENDQAHVFIGDTLRVELSSSGALGATTTTVEEFPIGIVMIMRPRINADGHLSLRIHPVVSSITSINASGLPQTSEREADTNVVMRDGETIAISGLIRDEDTKGVQEVPLLSKLPIIGELFRNRTRDKKRREVMIFVTVHIVNENDKQANPFGPEKVAEPDKKMP